MNQGCVVVILTFNSAEIIYQTIGQALKVSTDVLIVDSGSIDTTREIASSLSCEVLERQFKNYSDQRNWAINYVASDYAWQLHLDADEVLDDTAIAEIRSVLTHNRGDAWMLRRRDYFMGRELIHSGVNPWHLRLFRSGVCRCENRLYDQHFHATTPVNKLRGWMHDKNHLNLSDWTARHNRWSDLESKEILTAADSGADGVLQARAFGDARERTRWIKRLYYRLPGGIRAIAYFVYRYVFRLGFLDGREGFYFAFFQALWFRLLVDAKVSAIRQMAPPAPSRQDRA